ncbi:MAG: hypothetical protein WBI82_08375 [Sphaerochaeta sp.]
MPPFPPQGAGYLILLSQHSLGNGTMVMLVLLSLRWGMNVSGIGCVVLLFSLCMGLRRILSTMGNN